ncbi:YybH family protein [Massilia litorea]|jgi:ketosteroid isomerase-like protein|uniref:Nuclear transport factor 2 family protein n=1 Tax=Massilia litorea TaxID=2769491 RepID=A0A7L9U445_9BURK|nr:nuclear transport factor 2 family protein [Massilia litorea]QOL49042.1 nuclear transport factor 2 family protein [Massilia litorea]
MRLRSAGLLFLVVACVAAAAIGMARGSRMAPGNLRQQVVEAERGFAASMARRDFEAFTAYLSREAVFMSPGGATRGKDAVAQAWRANFDKPAAPFSWEPVDVEVLASGTLAFSSGPVRDAAGKQIGRFNSVWRLEGPGTWRVVFDRGCDCGR